MAFGETGAALSVIAGGNADEATGVDGTDAVHAGVTVTCSRFLNLPNGSARVPPLLAMLLLVLLAFALVIFSVLSLHGTEDAARETRPRHALTVAGIALLLASALCAWMLVAAW